MIRAILACIFGAHECECSPPHFAQSNGTCAVCARPFPQGAKLWTPPQARELAAPPPDTFEPEREA